MARQVMHFWQNMTILQYVFQQELFSTKREIRIQNWWLIGVARI